MSILPCDFNDGRGPNLSFMDFRVDFLLLPFALQGVLNPLLPTQLPHGIPNLTIKWCKLQSQIILVSYVNTTDTETDTDADTVTDTDIDTDTDADSIANNH